MVDTVDLKSMHYRFKSDSEYNFLCLSSSGVEQKIENLCVGGSSPPSDNILSKMNQTFSILNSQNIKEKTFYARTEKF